MRKRPPGVRLAHDHLYRTRCRSEMLCPIKDVVSQNGNRKQGKANANMHRPSEAVTKEGSQKAVLGGGER